MTTGMDRASALFGSDAKLGAALNPPVSRQAIAEWRARGYAPPERALDIARATGFQVPVVDLCDQTIAEIVKCARVGL